MKFTENVKPLLSKVNVIFFPIAFLNINSEPQGSTILASKEPWKKYEEQHEHFRDPEFRGIRYDLSKLPDDLRNKVWLNTKLHRRAGCRAGCRTASSRIRRANISRLMRTSRPRNSPRSLK